MRNFLVSFLEVFEIAFVAVVSVFLVRTFLIQPFVVSGSSMAPNFKNGDYLLVDELTYRFRPPERGEVVVFRYENSPSTFFIKRIIGLPGERVDIRNSKVEITPSSGASFTLQEPYLPAGIGTGGSEEYTLGPSEYFVLGDNRPFSFDSRSWGALPAKDMVGVVRIRLWPLREVEAFAAPRYSYVP